MNKREVIELLEDLRDYCEESRERDGGADFWGAYVGALTYAILIIREQAEKEGE
jgi:hypothetical protein